MRSRSIGLFILLGSALILASCNSDFPVTVSNPTPLIEVGPNQFQIQFSVPTPSFVTIVLQNMAGDDVRTLFAESVQTGVYAISFDQSGLERGCFYFITFRIGTTVRSSLIKLV